MSRRSEKSTEAERLYHDGWKLVEIAKKLEAPEGTVRRWKSTQDWDGKKKEPERSGNKANARTKNNANVRAKGRKEASINTSEKEARADVPRLAQNEKSKTNSQNPKARPGNQNAAGNSGGKGAHPENKHAVTTGQYETILFSGITSEAERRILEMPLDVLLLQEAQIKKGLIREQRMMERIDAAENARGGLLIDSVIKDKGVTVTRRGKQAGCPRVEEESENTQTIAESSSKRVERIEDSLTRVAAVIQRGIQNLYKMRTETAHKDATADETTLVWIEGVLNGKI